MNRKPRNIRELREGGYRLLSVKEEMRKNLIDRIKRGQELFPGIIGYEDSVIPQVENAILAGQDIIFLGERGQAKTRIIRSLVGLLDDEIPVIAGCEINDNPFQPICKSCRDRVAKHGDKVEISWLPRESRYGEKLATPDTTIADLIGEVDPIRVAEGRYLSDELTIHYGLIPRTNRGIFSINELPDLVERIQVGLFNLMEEKDIQIRGYKIRLPLDVYIVASANPEDYTNRGRIITPLKDRYGSQIRTHYPRQLEQEIEIMEQERTVFEDSAYRVFVPQYMKEIVAELTVLARRHSDINQRSGVSVRMSISNYENLVSNALRRAIRLGEEVAVPRISDLPFLVASTSGKIELETIEEEMEGQLVERLTQNTVLNTFNRYFTIQDFEEFLERFNSSQGVEVSEAKASEEYVDITKGIGGLDEGIRKLDCDHGPAATASAVEFILEGLHLNKRLNKEKLARGSQYRGGND
ncbi:MAG: magnesium chelatase [Dehalococcoidia bacterium]